MKRRRRRMGRRSQIKSRRIHRRIMRRRTMKKLVQQTATGRESYTQEFTRFTLCRIRSSKLPNETVWDCRHAIGWHNALIVVDFLETKVKDKTLT